MISCAAVCMFSAEMQNITLQIATPASSAIKLDGKLEEVGWKKAPVHGKYYVYMNKMGSIALTRTSCRLIYDANGVYIGIENFCDDPKAIRRTITTNNHSDIWRDDCAEIYFNPLADRMSFIRYAVNSNAATHSMSRDTTLLINGNYMTPGSKFACYIGDKSWNIDSFPALLSRVICGSLLIFVMPGRIINSSDPLLQSMQHTVLRRTSVICCSRMARRRT